MDMVNLNWQVEYTLNSIYTNGFKLSTITYQYKVYNIAKLYYFAIHFYLLFPFLWLWK
jgi:hypothetical protein